MVEPSLTSRQKIIAEITARTFALCCQILVALYLLGFALWYGMADGLKDPSGTPLGADFLNVYAAGFMANHGQAAQVYNWDIHGHAEQTIAGYAAPYFGWHYPPMFLAVASLVALAPYLWAFALYMGASFAGYWLALRRIAPTGTLSLWALAAFPGVFCNVSNGQNGFITTALFGGGLLMLETRPWLAGLLFGFLSYKPQFFVVIPVMLAVGGYRRVVLATMMSTGICAALSWAAFGAETWQAFFASATLTQHVILEQGATGWQKIQSVFSLARMWGCDISTAYRLQAIVAAPALLIAAWAWRSKATLALRASTLCAAILLTTPYLLDYDLVILAVPLAFWARERAVLRVYEKITLALLWLSPFLARNVGAYGIPFTVPLLIALMGLCVIRIRESGKNP